MQQSFIEEVVDDVWNIYAGIENLIFVLPSKRAGTFLKTAISKKARRTIQAPDIYSIEEFIEVVAGTSYANNTQQLFELYKAYLETGEYEKESFDSFLNWAPTILQDFNEIDRYLIDAKKLFSGLTAVQEVNHWSLSTEKTELIENYLHFWRHLEPIYQKFTDNLLLLGIGHQGLVYRKAFENIEGYLKDVNKTHIFLGFNALNNSESNIIQKMLAGKAHIYWDIDHYFLNDKLHDAGLFIRQHHRTWDFYKNNELKGLSAYYLTKKQIEIIGVPKNISQAKYVGNLLSQLEIENPSALKTSAVILGDENLLNPILNSIPSSISAVNITMGQNLENTQLASFFKGLLELHELVTEKGWFYKDFLSFLCHSYTDLLLKSSGIDVDKLQSTIKSRNWLYVNAATLEAFDAREAIISNLLFSRYDSDTNNFVERCAKLTLELKEIFSIEKNHMVLEQLYRFYNLFNQIKSIISTYSYVKNPRALKILFRQLMASETLDFQGDPLEGLQIMGMLESRNLDFETVILTSVNEGILPSGKSNNSFIPFELKIEHGLPTYKEKDAVYTYHFYRLLQRAKQIYILYNTEPDVLEGGERSRLITQLLTDENRNDIRERVAAPLLHPTTVQQEKIIKTDTLLTSIAGYAQKGFSPSSLSNYIRNPLDFYKRSILDIKDIVAVEETIAANTFGTIVHDTLEELYTPFIGQELSRPLLENAKTKIQSIVKSNFRKTYLDGNIGTGKNYLSYHVIIKYIQDFIDLEISELQNHTIKILALEKKLTLDLNITDIHSPILLKGKLDRIDEFDGVTRIIDYKTGKVEKRNVEIKDWDCLIEEEQCGKAFQLLCYSYMYSKTHPNQDLLAGIISIKNLREGLLMFAKKEPVESQKTFIIGNDMLFMFENLLYKLISEIFNPEIPFLEKQV
ncbi:PD-(D/E)XK nuclease family protein [Maribacter aestuarii]|uniref:PD-(D/E)XK nuclease family protein n=1 Tax=Maribacter aestuarii TaxID=1130723 RepID=UPI00248C54B6|nr:PD-(D/E)XK nuclease family protein [Maribacter aestuarii]